MNLLPRGVFELVMYYLISRRLGLKDAVAGVNLAGGEGSSGGLKKVWEEGKVGVGGRVRSLVLERLRMNDRAGVVGRWQQVCPPCWFATRFGGK